MFYKAYLKNKEGKQVLTTDVDATNIKTALAAAEKAFRAHKLSYGPVAADMQVTVVYYGREWTKETVLKQQRIYNGLKTRIDKFVKWYRKVYPEGDYFTFALMKDPEGSDTAFFQQRVLQC